MYESIEDIGFEKGEMISEIVMAERMLGWKIPYEKELKWMSVGQLEDILEEYRARKPLEYFKKRARMTGEILAAQRILKQEDFSEKELIEKTVEELKQILGKLESRLSEITLLINEADFG